MEVDPFTEEIRTLVRERVLRPTAVRRVGYEHVLDHALINAHKLRWRHHRGAPPYAHIHLKDEVWALVAYDDETDILQLGTFEIASFHGEKARRMYELAFRKDYAM
jgi:nicotinamide mononucleotide adenylyltransferase